MRKVLSLVLVASLILGACTKQLPSGDGQNPFYNPNGNGNGGGTDPTPIGIPVGDVPATFTKKAVLEEFTGEWCGWCPEGAKVMDDNIAANPGKVIGISVHDGDPMELPAFNSWIKGLTGVTGYPNGSVDRDDATGRGSWTGQITASLAKVAECGIAMVTKESGGLLDVDVYIGYNTPITAATNLTVAVIEDKVPQTSGGQSNYSTSVVVDANWKHGHVLRGFVTTANEGEPVTLNSSEKYTLVQFKGIDLGGMNITDMANVHLAAFINVNAGAATPSTRDVLNAQLADLNETKKWD